MSSNPSSPQIGCDSPKAQRGMNPESYVTPEETSPSILKRKTKSENLNFEKLWGEYLDEKVNQEMVKMVVEVRKECIEGEQWPSLDAIAYTQFAMSWSELRQSLRMKEKAKIERRVHSREEHEREMESTDPVSTDQGTQLRNGRRIFGLART
ncbi:MAG: hypothetical protein Q9169_002154 [Polycauliona sp. 2 TL-2023]